MSEKTFTGLYLDRELLDDIARELSEANCRTRNEFINKAIRFYRPPALPKQQRGADAGAGIGGGGADPGHRESTGAGAVQAGSGAGDDDACGGGH